MTEKEKYVEPILEIHTLQAADVITASTEPSSGENFTTNNHYGLWY